MTYLNSEISLHYCWIKSLKIWYSEFILQIKVYYWHRPVIQCSDSPALLYRSCRIKKVSSSTIQKLPHQKSLQLYCTEVAASKKSPALLYRSCRIKKSLQLYCTEVAASKKPHQKKVWILQRIEPVRWTTDLSKAYNFSNLQSTN
jgi:hypothetical protein